MARITITAVNKAIQAKHPNIILERGKGYFYICSDDEETALMIASLYTTSIPVYSITQQSIEQWVKDVDSLLNHEWDN